MIFPFTPVQGQGLAVEQLVDTGCVAYPVNLQSATRYRKRKARPVPMMTNVTG